MKRLKELRNAKGVSQQELADIIHVTQQSVFKYEHDMAEPDLDLIIACAKYFDTSVDYLIGYSDVPTRYESFPSDAITPFEYRLVEYYRRLSPTMKNLVEGVVDEQEELLASKKDGVVPADNDARDDDTTSGDASTPETDSTSGDEQEMK